MVGTLGTCDKSGRCVKRGPHGGELAYGSSCEDSVAVIKFSEDKRLDDSLEVLLCNEGFIFSELFDCQECTVDRAFDKFAHGQGPVQCLFQGF